MGQAQALGTCPAPCPQATRDTRLGLEARGPGCGSWRGAGTPDWCDKKKQVRAGHGQRLGGPQTQELPPPGKGQLQEQLRFVSEVRATFVGALTKEPKDPRLPLQPRLQAAPLPRIQPAT